MNEAGPEDEDRLYGLMEIAERQQAAVQAALDGLVAERAALAREREAREREALARGVRDIQVGAQGAVRSALAESLAGAATTGVAAVEVATAPLLVRLEGVTAQAGEVEAALQQLIRRASWRLLGWVAAALGGLVLVGWLLGTTVLWWNASAIRTARAETVQLQAEVAELRANRDAWVEAGLMAKLVRCGWTKRPCVQVDESAGSFGPLFDHRVLSGY